MVDIKVSAGRTKNNAGPSDKINHEVAGDLGDENSNREFCRTTPPRLILGHTGSYWAVWLSAAVAIGLWGGPLLAHLVHRFVTPLW